MLIMLLMPDPNTIITRINVTFTIDTSVENHNDSVLNVFRQKNGTGKFSVGVLGANLNMYGGNLDLVLATLQETYFHGGNFAAKLGLIMNIVFDLTAATDSVLFGERCVLIGTASVAEGKTIKDQDENLYTGELGKLTIENKTFTPYIAQPEKTAQDKYNLTVQENIDVNVLIDVRGHANDGEEIEKIVYTYPDITTQEKKTVTE